MKRLVPIVIGASLLLGATGAFAAATTIKDGQIDPTYKNQFLQTSTGALQNRLDNRYVRTSGDTMTGGLLIHATNDPTKSADPGILLEVVGTMSGRTIKATDTLASSGTLIVKGATTLRGTLSGAALRIMGQGTNSYVLGNLGIGTSNAAKTKLEVLGTISGSALTISGLKACDSLDTDLNGSLICGTDAAGSGGNFGTGNVLTIGNNRFVKKQGDTMTGGLLIVSGGHGTLPTIDAGLLLEVVGTASGRILHAQDVLRSSGALIVEGAVTLWGNVGIKTANPETALEVPGTISGSTITSGNRQIHPQKCASFIVAGSGSNVAAGQAKVSVLLAFSGSIVKPHAKHGKAGTAQTTYDININGVSRLSTKLTVDANEKCSETLAGGTCSDAAATTAVITQPKFAAWQELTIDVDSVSGTAPQGSVITVCFDPDVDGFTNY